VKARSRGGVGRLRVSEAALPSFSANKARCHWSEYLNAIRAIYEVKEKTRVEG
jgi:hypothetical protein